MGLIATTFVGGAGKWRWEYLEYFRDAEVVLIPENDQPEIKGKQDIEEQIHGTAKSINILIYLAWVREKKNTVRISVIGLT